MQIKNKRTHKEYYVTQEEWAKIIANPNLRYKYSVIDRSDITDTLVSKSVKNETIIPEEIINFKSLQKTKKDKLKKEKE